MSKHMTAPSLSYNDLKELKPCTYGLKRVAKLLGGAKKWNGVKISAAEARAAGVTLDDMLWVAATLAWENPDVERRLRLCLADFAAHVLHNYECMCASNAPREAIIAARAFARGEIDGAARKRASDAAIDAARAASGAAWAAASGAAWAVASDAAIDAAWATAWDAARAASDAVWTAASDAAWAAANGARAAEQDWQYDRLVLWLSDPEPADHPLPVRAAVNKAA